MKKSILIALYITLLFNQEIVYAAGYDGFGLLGSLLKLIAYILLFAFIMIFTLYGTRFIAKHMKHISNSRYMEIIDTIKISNTLQISIVKIMDDIYILGNTESKVHIIDKISEENFKYKEDDENMEFKNFRNNKLSRFLKGMIDEEEENE